MKKLYFAILLLVIALSASAQLQQGSGWAKSRGDSLNSGLSIGSGALNFTKWTFASGVVKNFIRSPIVDANGTVYVASTSGSTYALDGLTGTVLWAALTGPVSYSSPLVASNGNVYVGNDRGHIYSLDASTGDTNWSVAPNASAPEALGPPAMGPTGPLYIASNDGNLYALDPGSGATLWSFKVSGNFSGASVTPAVTKNGTIYLGGGPTVYSLDKTGKQVWSYTLPSIDGGSVTTPAVGPDGTIYVSSQTGYVYALDPATGNPKWVYQTGGGIFSSPALGPTGMVYICCTDQNVYAIDQSTGQLLWVFRSAAELVNSPAVAADGTVYVPSEDTYLYAVNGTTGDLNWQYPLVYDLFEPAIGADGSLYVPSGNGTLYAFPSGIAPMSLLLTPSTVVGGASSTGLVTLNKVAPAGGITLSISSNTSGIQVPVYLNIPAGQISGSFLIETPYVVGTFHATISATYQGESQKAVLTVLPLALTSFTISPISVAGGNPTTATVTMNGNAPGTGMVVSVTSSLGAAVPPGSVTIPAGQNQVTFQIPTIPVTATTYPVLTATLNSQSPQTAYLSVTPAQFVSLTFNPDSIGGGGTSTGTLLLNGVAPPAGLKATLSSNNSAAGVPATVKIAGGASSATFTLTSAVVTKTTTAIITATVANVSHAASITIGPPKITTLTLNPSTVTGTVSSVGTVTLDGKAPKGGTVVKLKSASKSATVPASVTVAFGKSSATFTVKTLAVASQAVVAITGTTSSASASANLTINPPVLTSVTVSPTSVVGGRTSTGTVKISAAAPTGGIAVTLTSSLSGTTVASKVTIPAGRTSVTFTVKTVKVNAKTSTTVSASAGGVSKTATLTIT